MVQRPNSFTAIIVDDEKKFRDALARMILDNFSEKITILARCKSVAEAVHAIRIHQPDLVFLDVEIPPSNGFELLEQLEEKNFEVVFTTGYDQYAIKAIKFSALDFLLKPFGVEELSEALNKFEEKVNKDKTQKQYELLLSNVKNVSDPERKIALPTLNGFQVVSLRDIVRCESDNNYTVFHLIANPRIVVSKPLKEYEELLEEFGFYRIHQSHLINLRYIKQYIKGEGGTVIMTDHSQIDVSRRKKDDFLQVLTSPPK